MRDYEFSVLVKLYLFGKKLQALVKNHNSDVMSQCVILRLVNIAPQQVSDIADIFSIKVSAATSKISEMEKLGLLVRKPSLDKRSHMVEITPKGKRMSNTLISHSIGITKAEATKLEALIEKIKLEHSK